jgi:hypothetical protein
MSVLDRRARWVLVGWLGVAFVVWNGFFDLLVSRGEKQYLLAQARYELGTGSRATMHEVMSRTIGDAVPVATLWSAFVWFAGAGTTLLLTRSRSARLPGGTDSFPGS